MSANAGGNTICLSMIVKNEAHVLGRCLASVRPLISAWVIVDTGSTDDTERVAKEALAGIPGVFVTRPWQDFATNRNEALELSRPRADYSLIIDADDELQVPTDLVLPRLTHDGYALTVLNGSERFERLHLVKNSIGWRYESPVHEYLTVATPVTTHLLEGVIYRIHLMEGARSRDPDKYLRDALLLEQVVARNPQDARATFYVARSYGSHGDWERAIHWYERFLKLEARGPEAFIALHSIGVGLINRNAPLDMVIAAFERAHVASPERAEPLSRAAHWCRMRGRPDLAVPLARRASMLPLPGPGHLHVDGSVYAWGALEELSLSAAAAGDGATGRAADERLVREGHAPTAVLNAARARLGMSTDDPRFAKCAPILERARDYV
jgi:glycosyltransferase involved in cell wall biosynthesis